MSRRRFALTLRSASSHALKKAKACAKERSSFTLIELLIVIAIVSVLSVVVILTLNPAELLKQARDSTRLSDLSTLNTSLNIFNVDKGGVGYTGNASSVYISVPDTSLASGATSTCASLGLPSLPSGYSYYCVSSSSLQKTDGTGWIPVNFQSISAGSPIPALPKDPINTTSSGSYYTYMMGGSWELTTPLESQKNSLGGSRDMVSTDGGQYTGLYEMGTSKILLPIDYGDRSLVAYWKFNEGAGTTAYDASGNGNNGTWNGAQVGTNGYYSAGKVGAWAGVFDGASSYVNSSWNKLTGNSPRTMSIWFKMSTATSSNWISWGADSQNQLSQVGVYNGALGYLGWDNDLTVTASTYADSSWHLATVSFDGMNLYLYIDGQQKNSKVTALNTAPSQINIGRAISGFFYLAGSLDDVRIYNRALSASEISALYNGTK